MAAMATAERPTKRPSEDEVPSPVLRTDGIAIRSKHLTRQDVVEEIVEIAQARQHVVVRAPATGKTSLLQLVEKRVL